MTARSSLPGERWPLSRAVGMREFYASRAHATSTSQVRSRPRRVRSSARVPKTRAGLEAKSCGKLRPVGACPARRGHYGARPTVSRESSCNLRTLYSRIHRVHRRMLAVDSKPRNTQAAARQGPLRRDLVVLRLASVERALPQGS
jgi:hypothetical protein